MADSSDKPGSEVVLGKKWAGEQFSTIKSAAEVQAEVDAQKPFDVENAIPIDSYFNNKRITDPVMRSMMLAYTKVRKATMEAFDEIFAKF